MVLRSLADSFRSTTTCRSSLSVRTRSLYTRSASNKQIRQEMTPRDARAKQRIHDRVRKEFKTRVRALLQVNQKLGATKIVRMTSRQKEAVAIGDTDSTSASRASCRRPGAQSLCAQANSGAFRNAIRTSDNDTRACAVVSRCAVPFRWNAVPTRASTWLAPSWNWLG